MNKQAAWARACKILCIRLDNMGDVIMTSPAMRALRAGRPDRHITLLASRTGVALAPFLTEVDHVIQYDAPWVKGSSDDCQADQQMIATLRAQAFDAAVIFTVYSQSALPAALMCRLAGIRLVLGHARENPYRLLSDWVPDPEPLTPPRHEVQRQLDLVAAVGVTCLRDARLSFATRDSDRYTLRATLHTHGLWPSKGWVVVHCGASAPSRRYSPLRYAKVISLLESRGLPILLTGSADERPLTQGVLAHCASRRHVTDLTGRLSLGELACLIEDARLLICNNTGPAHIAAAVQTPVVDLYALTNPQHSPWQVPHRLLYRDVPCRNCYSSICKLGTNACLDGVEPEDVVAAALELIDGDSGKARPALVA